MVHSRKQDKVERFMDAIRILEGGEVSKRLPIQEVLSKQAKKDKK